MKQVMVWVDGEFVNRIHYFPDMLEPQYQDGILTELPSEPKANEGYYNELHYIDGKLVWIEKLTPPTPKTEIELLQEENERLKQQLAELDALKGE